MIGSFLFDWCKVCLTYLHIGLCSSNTGPHPDSSSCQSQVWHESQGLCFGFSYLLNYNFAVCAVPWHQISSCLPTCHVTPCCFFFPRVFAKLRFHPLLISRCQQPELKPRDKDLKDEQRLTWESKKPTNPAETVEAKIKVHLQLVVCCARGPFTVFATYAASAQARLRWNKSSWKFLKFCNSWGKPWFD